MNTDTTCYFEAADGVAWMGGCGGGGKVPTAELYMTRVRSPGR